MPGTVSSVLATRLAATSRGIKAHKRIADNQNQGYLAAEIVRDRDVRRLPPGGCARGLVSRDTITAQLVYEIQGPSYLNPNVIAALYPRLDLQCLAKLGRRHRHYRLSTATHQSVGSLLRRRLPKRNVSGRDRGRGCREARSATPPDRRECRRLDRLRRAPHRPIRRAPCRTRRPKPVGSVQFRVFTQAQQEDTLGPLRFAIQSYEVGPATAGCTPTWTAKRWSRRRSCATNRS